MNKTQEERVKEMITLCTKLRSFGLTRQYPDIEDLYKIINDYIKNGKSVKGSILFIEGKKKIFYDFTNIINKESTIFLKHYEF